MNVNQASADERFFEFDLAALKRGQAMSYDQRMQWAQEMMQLQFEVIARLQAKRSAGLNTNELDRLSM
jgi:hypothetical protein